MTTWLRSYSDGTILIREKIRSPRSWHFHALCPEQTVNMGLIRRSDGVSQRGNPTSEGFDSDLTTQTATEAFPSPL